jgi:hypothetical protein
MCPQRFTGIASQTPTISLILLQACAMSLIFENFCRDSGNKGECACVCNTADTTSSRRRHLLSATPSALPHSRPRRLLSELSELASGDAKCEGRISQPPAISPSCCYITCAMYLTFENICRGVRAQERRYCGVGKNRHDWGRAASHVVRGVRG